MLSALPTHEHVHLILIISWFIISGLHELKVIIIVLLFLAAAVLSAIIAVLLDNSSEVVES